MCGADPGAESRPWVLLNRYGYGSGRARGMTEGRNSRGEYLWEVGDDLDAEDELVTGPLLCFPSCLQQYLEGKMVEADIATGHTR